MLKSDPIHQFAEIGGINAEVGGQILLGNHLQQMGTAPHKIRETGLHVKGHQFMLALDHPFQKIFSDLAKKGSH